MIDVIAYLPIQFAIVIHSKYTRRLNLRHCAHGQSLGTNLNNINRIVVTESLQLRVLLVGILPCLGKAAIVPEYMSMVISKLSLLDILRSWIIGFFGCLWSRLPFWPWSSWGFQLRHCRYPRWTP